MEVLKFEKAHYVLSAPTVDILPVSDVSEIAFFGRSNVGKSSLLNYLCGQKSLARVSKTPGRTQALNLFEAELEKKPVWILDLPGVGYAKLSQAEKRGLSEALSGYLDERKQLTCLVHLIDCRRHPNAEDIALSEDFRRHIPNYLVVMTKIDQLPLSKRGDTQKRFAQILRISLDTCLTASSEKQLGREHILDAILATLSIS
jgi:GTP-binding protein